MGRHTCTYVLICTHIGCKFTYIHFSCTRDIYVYIHKLYIYIYERYVKKKANLSSKIPSHTTKSHCCDVGIGTESR